MKIYVAGSLNMDLVINTDILPDSGVTVSGYGFMSNPGGKGANQAVAAAKSGGDVRMIGCVGREFGRELTLALTGYNVNADRVIKTDDVSSGIAVIIVKDGDNRIILDKGANALVSEEAVREGLKDAEQGDWLITQLEIPTEGVIAALEEGRKKGMYTVLNPAPAMELPDKAFRAADYFVPNQSETLFYTGIYPDSEGKAEEAAAILRAKGVKNVIITMGERGSAAFGQFGKIVSQAVKVKAVDTTAAGDTFVGALTVRLSEGASLEEAMAYANKAAAIAVTRKGAQQSIPTRGETEQCGRK